MKNKNNQRGSIITVAVFGVLAMVGTAGMAVDMGRAQLAQAKLSSALDAAGLAAGSSINTQDIDQEVTKYLNVNFDNYLDSELTDVESSFDERTNIITLSAKGHIDTTFMKIFGIDEVEISAESEITRAINGLELALVLDNTGSMAGSRLTGLVSAANELVTILFGADTDDQENLWISVVPFSQAVNVGTDKTGWLTANSISSKTYGTAAWGGCVDARLSGGDITDAPPATQKFEPYYWPDDSNNDWIVTTTTTKNGKTTTTTTYTNTSSKGPNKYCPQRLLELTNNEPAIHKAINSMVAVGNTHVSEGAIWGWRMLSPRWRGVWGGSMNTNNLPLNYNTPKMNKAAIIMTDGENTIDNSNRGAYWYLNNGRLGTTNSSQAVTQLNNRLKSVCTSMKNNNIVVYTIAFGSPGTTIQNLLKSCASQTDYYFNSPTSAELTRAFRQIGDSLSNLRVSK